MDGAGFNERKLEILRLVGAGLQTSGEVAGACGISQSCASALLARYWRQGLLRRYTDSMWNLKVYSLSERGLDRLEWLMREFEVF